ncbi:unnamed protein product [Miscanthus lutarioriparius]|uniref:Late embryogenesis abundant protein LEA-2 subgroup domain-containing protein n=1 Tax=Miscanthus lutarioriparius TaxID=422564 RepID=A0A811SIC4_9POAL|nr:unnamed protein product [Miscanthus lutarioriparius]
MRADGDDDGKTSAFRCQDAARYTVAAVVTVLIVAVVVTSLKVVLRPESLRLSVVDGVVYSTPLPASEAVTLQLNLRAENPSGRARMYFLNVTAYLFDGATPASTPTPDEDCIIFFNPTDEAVRQPAGDGGGLDDERGGDERPWRHEPDLLRAAVTYYCRPLLVGGSKGGKVSMGRKDVLCTDNLGSQ